MSITNLNIKGNLQQHHRKVQSLQQSPRDFQNQNNTYSFFLQQNSLNKELKDSQKIENKKIKQSLQRKQSLDLSNNKNQISESFFLQDCLDRNQQSFINCNSQRQFEEYLSSNIEENGKRRIIRHQFVKFPYSKNMIQSMYQKDFKQFQQPKNNECFNLEKEIFRRPKSMQKKVYSFITTARDSFKDPQEHQIQLKNSLLLNQSCSNAYVKDRYPFPKYSQYKAEFQNWGGGKKLSEKRPQYPVYSLEFKGKSKYKEDCEKQQHLLSELYQRRKQKEYENMLQKNYDLQNTTNDNKISQENKNKKRDKLNWITTKMKDVQYIQKSLEQKNIQSSKSKEQMIINSKQRSQSVLEGNISVSRKLKVNSKVFTTSYKTNFVQHPISNTLYIPYP